MKGSQKGIGADGRRADVPCLVPSVVHELQLRISTSRLVAVSLIPGIPRWHLLLSFPNLRSIRENASIAVVLRDKFVE